MPFIETVASIDIPLTLEYPLSRKERIIRPRIIREAFKIAQKSKSDFRHGAIIFSKNNIIAKGYNQPFKTHPNGSGIYSSIHAEIMAIINALKVKRDLSNLDILVIRLNKKNEFALSKPCKDCMNLIENLNLNPIWSIK